MTIRTCRNWTPDGSLWECISDHESYSTVNDRTPWGAHIRDTGKAEGLALALAYVLTANTEELAHLAGEARENLAEGFWQGYTEATEDLGWMSICDAFMALPPGSPMPEEFVRTAAWDLAVELAAMRGLCACDPGMEGDAA